MRKSLVFVLMATVLVAAGPASRPVETVADADAIYRNRAAAAKAEYTAEMAKAEQERVANLKLLLGKAMKAEDVDQVVAIKKRIDDLKAGTVEDIDPGVNTAVAGADSSLYGVDGKGKKVVYLCDAAGSMLGIFGNVKDNVKKSINALDPKMEFNVIFFSEDNAFLLFKDGPHTATDSNKHLAMGFIEKAVSTGGEQPAPAIKAALRERPDLIYFLTDGLNQLNTIDELPSVFKTGNPEGKIRVNCIYIQGHENPRSEAAFKKISEFSHGTSTVISKNGL